PPPRPPQSTIPQLTSLLINNAGALVRACPLAPRPYRGCRGPFTEARQARGRCGIGRGDGTFRSRLPAVRAAIGRGRMRRRQACHQAR
ncbi:hypothetical protein OSI29_20745, partial [Mycobacterium ulcerans]|nr:hypothetical protein [Mycobacterium ulcerans]MEB3991847.1 hypothetical protein [Mycobacterium ulcerans]MEB4004245.1 hypothetical protein [Mycobacterium ulcerans]MEB4045576.1 hypothetical protein [Mycobacterium ulcerans]MEB4049732.1 hypothetical protein [Mycobacterium ulcerans]